MNPPDSARVLVAEDDPHTRDALVTILVREGFRATAAADGQAAWDAYCVERPDLVCLDVMMPRLDGYEVCRRIRRADPLTPVLFLTAKSEEIDTVVGLELGADDYVAKPFGVREILARIHALLRRSRSAGDGAPGSFHWGRLEVFPNELRASLDGRDIPLSPRDLQLLRLFHAHPGEVLARDRIYDEVWGYDHLPNSRSLDQHISQLRKKIEPDPAQPVFIRTVHGAGYRHDPPGT